MHHPLTSGSLECLIQSSGNCCTEHSDALCTLRSSEAVPSWVNTYWALFFIWRFILLRPNHNAITMQDHRTLEVGSFSFLKKKKREILDEIIQMDQSSTWRLSLREEARNLDTDCLSKITKGKFSGLLHIQSQCTFGHAAHCEEWEQILARVAN